MVDFTNALRLLEEKEAKTYLSTGCVDLDRLIGNGVEPGVFYLFYGDPQSGIDLFLHQLMAGALDAEDGAGKVVYLNCGNYREEKTLFDIPTLVRFLKARKLDPKEGLERVLVFCAFSEEQQEQVIEEVRQTIEGTKEIRLLVAHNIAKLFTAENKHTEKRYKRIPRLQRVVLRLWQTCAARSVAMVASCKPTETRKGGTPRPEGGRYLSHEANVIVYLEKVGGLVPTPQAYLVKHPAKPHGRVVLKVGSEGNMGRITVPFKMRLEQELEELKAFRDALKDLERQTAYDEIVKACTSEQGAMANTDIPAVLDAMLLTATVDNSRRISHLSRRVDSLEKSVRKLESRFPVDDQAVE
jgi:RecA/RadA recombinase